MSTLCLLARCDWVTVFTGVKWKHLYVNKHWHPEKFQVFFSYKVFWLKFSSLKSLFLADIWSIFMKSGDYVRNILNPMLSQWYLKLAWVRFYGVQTMTSRVMSTFVPNSCHEASSCFSLDIMSNLSLLADIVCSIVITCAF